MNNYEKEDLTMKKGGLFCFCIMVILLPKLAVSEVFVNETFDDGAFNPPSKYICDIPEPPGCTNTARHVIDVKHHGTHSLECVYNQAGAAGVKVRASDYGAGSSFGEDAYLRFYIKYDTNFRFYSMTKMIIWHGNHVYFNINGCRADGSNAGDENGSRYGRPTILCESGPSSWMYVDPAFVVDVENQANGGWWMFEWNLNGNTGETSLWIMRPQDSVPTKVIDNARCNDCDGDNGTIDINWINAVSGGSGGKCWIDDVVIADEYSNPINQPSPPTGLKIINVD